MKKKKRKFCLIEVFLGFIVFLFLFLGKVFFFLVLMKFLEKVLNIYIVNYY